MEGQPEGLRRAELMAVRRRIAPGTRPLELGGGSGEQAGLLADHGCAVAALDLPARQRLSRPLGASCYVFVLRAT